MESKQYFILEGKIKRGPFTIEDLKSIGIEAKTKVWCEGLDKWKDASNIPELQQSLTMFPSNKTKKKWIVPVFVLIILAIAGFASGKYLFGNNAPLPVTKESPKLNNQQLYTIYSPGVVLIKHKYIYEINTGLRKFYFNEFYSYDTNGYLSGLTEDSTVAVKEAEAIQGTGFFINKEGVILTNRHVAQNSPNADDQESIAGALVKMLNTQVDYNVVIDSIKNSQAQNDSLLTVMLQDSLADNAKVAEIRQKIAEAQQILESEEEEAFENRIKIDQETVSNIAGSKIVVRKITLDIRVYLPGTNEIGEGDGMVSNIISNSDDPDVDLALIQLQSKRLPDSNIVIPDLTRVQSTHDSTRPQMSERLILIGYNRGTLLSKTADGIKAQLTEGKISQNTDSYKLMYTIPTLPGSSGSPVLDERGRLVSVNFAGISDTQNFNYGIQPKKIKEFLDKNDVAI